jgi:hypothetical protein
VAGSEKAHSRTSPDSVIPVRFRRSAQQDIQKAFDYFEAQRAGLGAEFLERVEDAADRISSNPYTY